MIYSRFVEMDSHDTAVIFHFANCDDVELFKFIWRVSLTLRYLSRVCSFSCSIVILEERFMALMTLLLNLHPLN